MDVIKFKEVPRFDNRKAYGLLILSSPYGDFYWSEFLQLLTFVELGKKNLSKEVGLASSKNDLQHAVKQACQMMAYYLRDN